MHAFFKAMDETGVVVSVVIGMPVVKKGNEPEETRPTYHLDNDSHILAGEAQLLTPNWSRR